MLMFLLFFAICALLGYFVMCRRKMEISLGNRKNISVHTGELYVLVISVLMLLVCGLRDIEIGVDTKTYVSTFLIPDALESSVDGNAKYEIGYVLFVKLLRLFTDSHQIYLFATSLVIFVGLYVFVRKNCNANYGIALMIYFAFLYYVDFSAIRQAMALSIAINSLQFLKERKWIPAILIILLGASFQMTALLLLVMVPFIYTTREKLKVAIALALSIVGILIFEPLVGVVLKLFPIYERYWNSEMMEGSGGIGLFAILVSALCVLAAGMLFADQVQFKNARQRSEFVLALVGSVFTVAINLVGRKYGIFSRMTRYFIPFVMVLAVDIYRCCIPKLRIDMNYLCNLVKRLKLNRWIKLEQYTDREQYPALAQWSIGFRDIYYWLVAATMGIYFYTIMKVNLYCIIPYRFFFT